MKGQAGRMSFAIEIWDYGGRFYSLITALYYVLYLLFPNMVLSLSEYI